MSGDFFLSAVTESESSGLETTGAVKGMMVALHGSVES